MIILGTNSIKDTGYNVANSYRSNSGDSPKLSKTFSSASNSNTTFTVSAWVKRSKLGANQDVVSAFRSSDGLQTDLIRFGSGDDLEFYAHTTNSSGNADIQTNRLFRDVGAWYHIVVRVDTTQGTDTNRVRIYVNGVQETSFSTSNYMSQNGTIIWGLGSGTEHTIGAVGTSNYFGGYVAEVVYLDSQSVAPTTFGEFDDDSGIWKPIDVSGLTFGDEGFYLDYADSADLGDDESGNGNDFAETGIAAINQVTDTPTNNFCTLSPLADSTSILSDGNCVNNADTSQTTSKGSIAVSNGRWYTECKITTSNQYPMLGIWSVETTAFQNPTDTSYPGQVTPSYGGYGNGSIYANGSNTGSQSFTWGNGNIIGIYLDLESSTKTIKWYKDGSSIATLDLATTTDAFVFGDYNSANALTASWNFGNPAFAISSGNTDANGYGNFEFSPTIGGVDYFAICTKNLAEHG